MKKLTKTMILTTVVALLPILFGLAIYDKLPAQVPTHWGANGQVNGYSSKAMAVIGLPIFLAAIGLFTQFMLEHDPKKANMAGPLKTMCRWICPVMSIIICPITLLAGLGYSGIPIPLIVSMMVGILFLVIGNYLPKCKQSYTMGIRLPWTLNSEENWNRTHRFAGKLWIACGLLFFVEGVVAQFKSPTMAISAGLIGIVLVALIPTIYSYLLYRKGV